MEVPLTPELGQFVRDQVRTGRYQDAGAVIRDSLRLLREQEDPSGQKLEELRREIQIGIDAADQGMTTPFDDALMEEIEREGQEMLAGIQRPPR